MNSDNKHTQDIDIYPQGVEIFHPKDWLQESGEDNFQKRATFCIKHLINNKKLGDNLKVLEVGPLPIFEEFYEGKNPPISFFKKEIPNNIYLGIGGHFINDNKTKEFMGGVDFINGHIDTRYSEIGIDLVKDYFGGSPDIIYGKHVYENSPSKNSTFPFGTSYMLDGTAALLKEDGYLIIDNYGGAYYKVLKGDYEYSKHLKLVAVYYYGKDEGIFIYKKPLGTDELAESEINEIEYKRTYYSLQEKKQKLEKSLLEYEKRKNSIIKEMSNNKEKIKKFKLQLEKINISPKQIDDKQSIIERLEKSINDLYLKNLELREKLINLPFLYEEKRFRLGEIISQIEIVKEKLSIILNKKT